MVSISLALSLNCLLELSSVSHVFDKCSLCRCSFLATLDCFETEFFQLSIATWIRGLGPNFREHYNY
jgi:hypothetical protein